MYFFLYIALLCMAVQESEALPSVLAAWHPNRKFVVTVEAKLKKVLVRDSNDTLVAAWPSEGEITLLDWSKNGNFIAIEYNKERVTVFNRYGDTVTCLSNYEEWLDLNEAEQD